MSRLIIKNLPKDVTEEKLKEVFGFQGQVTDVQLKYTRDGKFRHFGFVGFKAEDTAATAKEYLNNTYIGTCKIQVEVCSSLGDPKKPRAWSKYSADSAAFRERQKGSVKDGVDSGEGKHHTEIREEEQEEEDEDIFAKYEDDPKFKEFMEIHNKSKKMLWGNDSVTVDDPQKDEDEAVQSDTLERSDVEEEEEKDSDVKTAAKSDLTDLQYLKSKVVKEVQGDVEVSPTESEEGASDNDDSKHVDHVKKCQETKKKPKKKKVKEHVKLNYTVKIHGFPCRVKRRDVKHFLCPLKPKSIRVPQKVKGIAFVSFSSEKELRDIMNKDRTFMSGRRIFVKRYQEKKDSIVNSNKQEEWKTAEEALKSEETVAESGRIFVRNLSYYCTEAELQTLFSKYGPLSEINLPIDRLTRKIKGFAFVTYMIPEHAMAAYSELDGSTFQGRLLHLLPGKSKKTLEDLLESDGLTFKEKKKLKEKLQAESSHNWNTLFLGTSAVADIIAERYNTSKQEVLDDEGSQSVAVRLALGETQIVTETRDFLVENGVHLDAFNCSPQQRSKTVIIAKNLPSQTSAEELRTMFQKSGEVGRVLMPPSGITAIIEFLNASEARSAFRRLAYTKFYHIPLYLEWAPIDVFSSPFSNKSLAESKPDGSKADPEREGGVNKLENEKTGADNMTADQRDVDSNSEDEEEEVETNATIFVKNLNFNTDETSLKKHFDSCGSIHSVSISRKKDMKQPGTFLSMGYGFVQFKKQKSMQTALKTKQHSILDEHQLELKSSNRTSAFGQEVKTARKKSTPGKQKSTKILVRNVPFQATKKEVSDLFKTFGELKAVRLPKKMVGTGSHRGFAFVDFHTKHEAKRAFKALCQSTHLYGRRLVLEWAATDETVDELRRKTADHFLSGPARKKPKLAAVFQDAEMMN